MTYEEIYRKIMDACHYDPDVDIEMLDRVKGDSGWVNSRYRTVIRKIIDKDPNFNRGEDNLVTTASYSTGTVTTNGTTTITGDGTTFTSAMVGRKFKLDLYDEVYEIAAFVSTTEITLSDAVNDDADDELGYVIYENELDLPSDCGQVVGIRQYLSPTLLPKIGLIELREKFLDAPPSSASSNIDPLYWSFLTKTKIIVHPAPSRQILLPIDYTKELTLLSDDDDEPIFKDDFHDILIYGGMADLRDYDDDNRSAKDEARFVDGLRDLIIHTVKNTDKPSLKPKMYRT